MAAARTTMWARQVVPSGGLGSERLQDNKNGKARQGKAWRARACAIAPTPQPTTRNLQRSYLWTWIEAHESPHVVSGVCINCRRRRRRVLRESVCCARSLCGRRPDRLVAQNGQRLAEVRDPETRQIAERE